MGKCWAKKQAFWWSEAPVSFFPYSQTGQCLKLRVFLFVNLFDSRNVCMYLINIQTYKLKSDRLNFYHSHSSSCNINRLMKIWLDLIQTTILVQIFGRFIKDDSVSISFQHNQRMFGIYSEFRFLIISDILILIDILTTGKYCTLNAQSLSL